MPTATHTIREIKIAKRFTKNLPYSPKLKERARKLRKAGVLSEVLFWQQVHKSKFWNIDFDRQKIIGSYIVDFYVKSLSLVIEIDGPSHIGKEEYDQIRDDYLSALGLKIYRIPNEEVKNNLNDVLRKLENYIISNYPQ